MIHVCLKVHKRVLGVIELKGLKQLYVNTNPLVVERIHVTGGTVLAKVTLKCRRKNGCVTSRNNQRRSVG
jgi:hypothetical protein